jgi:hypothetical protein
MSKNSSLIIEVRPGDSLEIHGGVVTVELVHKSGQLARLRVTAPREVQIKKVTAKHDDAVPSMADLQPS